MTTVNVEHIDRIADIYACIHDEDARREIRQSIESAKTAMKRRDERIRRESQPTKACRKCERELPRDVEYFPRDRNGTGLYPHCKACVNGWTTDKGGAHEGL